MDWYDTYPKIISESSRVDAYDLKAENAKVKITDHVAVYVNCNINPNIDKTDIAHVSKEAPQNIEGLASQNDKPNQRPKIETRFIDF